VEVRTVLFKSLDQLLEQFLTRLVPEMEDVLEGIHNRIHAAQSIEVPLPVSALALCHQLLSGQAREVGVEATIPPLREP
jgi:hypothetical protein